MTIKFYNVRQDPKDLQKTLVDTGSGKNLVKTVTGNIKTDCPIEDPELEIAYDSDLLNANYIYISEFSRYYFITGKTVSTQRIFINAHVDVLFSHDSGILNLTGIIERQADPNNCNLYLADKYFKTEERHLIRTEPFYNGGSVGQFTPGASSFVLTTGGTS